MAIAPIARMTLRRRPRDHLRLAQISNLARGRGVPTVATNDVLFHMPERRILQDVVTCIRERTTIDDAGFKRERHADRYLKPPDEMARLFRALAGCRGAQRRNRRPAALLPG